MNQMIYLTYLAQVRQRRICALIFPLKNVPIARRTLLTKVLKMHGLSHKETVTIGIAHVAVLGERNRNMEGSLKGVAFLRKNSVSRSLRSLAKGGN